MHTVSFKGRGGGGEGAVAQQPPASLRVALPTEFFVGLVNIHTELTTHTAELKTANFELLALRTFVENGLPPGYRQRNHAE